MTAAELAALEERYRLVDPLVVKLVAEYRVLDPRAACPCFDETFEKGAEAGG